MAVSGSKSSDFLGSVSSTEDYDHTCDTCLTADLHVEAHGFCVDCHEYLCKTCYTFHQRTKALRHHKLLDNCNIDKQAVTTKASDECTEKCALHRKEVIKFFCRTHEDLGCTDCMTMGHRTCDLDYIPDKCANIGDSDECRETIEALEKKTKEADEFLAKAAVKDKAIDDAYDQATKEINTFRKEINDKIDAIQKHSQTEVKHRKSLDKQRVQSILASSTTFSSGIKKLQAGIQNNKTLNQKVQLFIDIKRAKLELKSTSVQQAEECLDTLDPHYTIIKGIVLKQTSLIELGTRPLKLISQTLINATREEDIKVRNKNKTTCTITGIAVLPSQRLVLADFRNKNIKIVDTCQRTVIEEEKLESEPFDIAILPRDQIAVTIPNFGQILIMTTVDKLLTVNTLNIKGRCYGIVYHNDSLYVVCQSPRRVLVLDMQGDVMNTLSLADDSKFYGALYITMSYDNKSIYVSNTLGTSSVVNITLQGEITAEYTGFMKDVQVPRGMIVLSDGSLLVCCRGIDSLYRISGDLKQEWEIKDGITYPSAICYFPSRNEVVIGSYGDDHLRVLNVQC